MTTLTENQIEAIDKFMKDNAYSKAKIKEQFSRPRRITFAEDDSQERIPDEVYEYMRKKNAKYKLNVQTHGKRHVLKYTIDL